MLGHDLQKKLAYSPREDTNLLKCIYGQLYNGKLALRYGHAQRTSDLYAICLTTAHILPENVRTTTPCVLAVTMSLVN